MNPKDSIRTERIDRQPTHGGGSGFDRFRLSQPVRRGIGAAGFESPRPIQRDTLPAALAGRDVLGLAQTGTGKTAAFALPILERLEGRRAAGPRALIVAPTRELANQIDAEIRLLAKFTRVRTATVYGGVPLRSQVAALRREPDVLIACPGRLLDLRRQGAVRLDRVEVLVIDEADHMFDMGFLPDLRRILAALPERRQNLLFSATMPREIRGLADALLRDPHVVELAHAAPASTIAHGLYPVRETRKLALLEKLLADERLSSAIVFTRTKHRARRLAGQLDKGGHRAVALQGNMSQSQRDRAMRSFRQGRFDILVATDIAARGIDVTRVSHVINFDVPSTPVAYTHRIGRTGRSERDGRACTFVTADDRDQVRAIERMIGAEIPRFEVPGFTEAQGHRGGRRAPRRVTAAASGPGSRATRSRRRPGRSSR
jgi:ATP-dependent RNA helicase RhlE